MAKKINYAELFTLRKDGRYVAVIPARDGGKPKYLYDRDPAKLYAKLQAAKEPQQITFAKASEEWQLAHFPQLSEGTQAAYKAPLQLIEDYHGAFAIDQVTAAEIERVLLADKAKGRSYKHAACVLSMYTQIFDFAILKGWVQYNPARAVDVPRGMPRQKREAPEDDVIRQITAAAHEPFGLFPMFLLYTGFRAGEAMGAQWGDVDFKRKEISCRRSVERHFGKPYVKPPKSEAGYRTVPLLDGLAALLVRPKSARDEDLIFPGKDGGIMTSSEMRAKWVRWCKAAGLAELVETSIRGKDGKPRRKTYYTGTLTAHQLRHGYCTILYEAGVDEMTAMDLMGHSDIEITRKVYTHLRKRQRDKATDLLNDKFNAIVAK